MSNAAWRKANPEKWNEAKKRNYDKGRPSVQIPSRWTDREINLILKSKLKDRFLAKILKRSVQAIQFKRHTVLKISLGRGKNKD